MLILNWQQLLESTYLWETWADSFVSWKIKDLMFCLMSTRCSNQQLYLESWCLLKNWSPSMLAFKEVRTQFHSQNLTYFKKQVFLKMDWVLDLEFNFDCWIKLWGRFIFEFSNSQNLNQNQTESFCFKICWDVICSVKFKRLAKTQNHHSLLHCFFRFSCRQSISFSLNLWVFV